MSNKAPCPWPGCRERATFRSMAGEDRGKRITYYRLRCKWGHKLISWAPGKPTHVLAVLRGHEIHG